MHTHARTIARTSGSTNVYVPCRDVGDERNNANGTSATTCKVFEAVKYVAAHYRAEYVWRVGDDAYFNLAIFFEMVSKNLIPDKRLYLGKLRKPKTLWGREKDLLLERQPALHDLYGLYKFGQYMLGYGWALSWDVADFLASVKIPPRLTWCEDVIVGFWLNPFDVQFMEINRDWEYVLCNVDVCKSAANRRKKFVLIHYMTQSDWDDVYHTGSLRMPDATYTPQQQLLLTKPSNAATGLIRGATDGQGLAVPVGGQPATSEDGSEDAATSKLAAATGQPVDAMVQSVAATAYGDSL
jgi:hypothetical protein